MAEQKKAYDEYTIECKEIELDNSTITSNDIKQKQFSSSYKVKGKYEQTPGTLTVRTFTMDDDDGNKLKSVIFDVCNSAKNDKGDPDPSSEYKATVKEVKQ